jgi:hypothetical protein
LSADPEDGGEVSGGGNFVCGDTITVTATPACCYAFVNWTDENDILISTDNPYTFVVTDSLNLVAHFEDATVEITALLNPENGGEVEGDGSYFCGESVTLTAIPNDCHTFSNWTDDSGNILTSNFSYDFVVTCSQTFTANYIAKTYPVLAMADPLSGGTINGINIFAQQYACGDTASLFADPNPGYTFINWTEDDIQVHNQPLYEFPVTAQRVLYANFELNPYVLTLQSNPPAGATLPLGAGFYSYGAIVDVSVIPDPCYTFINWTQEGVEVSNQLAFNYTVTESCTLFANFERKNYDVTLSVYPSGAGYTIPFPGTNNYDCGDTLTITAYPTSDYDFIEWQEDNMHISSDNPYELEVTGTRDLVAIFALKTNIYTITATADPEDAGEVFGAGNYEYGEMATLTAEPDSCHTFAYWMENDFPVSLDNPWTFEVTGNRDLVAIFTLDHYSITVLASVGGSAAGGGTIDCGDPITVTATPEDCWEFVNWTDESGGIVSTDAIYNFIVTEDAILTANFEEIIFNLVVLPNPPEGGDVTGGASNIPCNPEGTFITIEATPYCSVFAGWWTTDDILVSTDNPYTFNLNEHPYDTLFARFEMITYNISLSVSPPDGGTTVPAPASYNYPCDTTVTVSATPSPCFTFINWTENGVEVWDKPIFTFKVEQSRNLVANFEKVNYEITLIADPPMGGIVESSGHYACGDTIAISATPELGFKFEKWTTLDGLLVSNVPVFYLTVSAESTFVAHFSQSHYRVTVLANDPFYGTTDPEGTTLYEAGSIARVRAYETDCYHFINWTTSDSVEVSANNIFEFEVTKDTTLIANFFALDFDTYCPTLWCNTFQLDLFKLRTEFDFEIIDCKWYKNGMEEVDTRTINHFSYSACPEFGDWLDFDAVYMFKLITKYHGTWCSTQKIIFGCKKQSKEAPQNLVIFPNPTLANNSFTVENVIEGETVMVYNQFGICVHTLVATGDIITMTLNASSGVYLIRCGERYGKVVIIK